MDTIKYVTGVQKEYNLVDLTLWHWHGVKWYSLKRKIDFKWY